MGDERKRRILVADDDPSLRKMLALNLERAGFEVLLAADGDEAYDMASKFRPDLAILDVRMPGRTGIEVTRELRQNSNIPIIIATTESAEIDRVVGLELGADDYVPKPYSPREIVARVHAVLRRAAADASSQGGTLQAGPFTLDLDRFVVARDDRQSVNLTPREFDILRLLASQPGKVFTRGELLETVWGLNAEAQTRTLDFHMRELRKKIEDDPSKPRFLRTVRGVGYRFDAE